MNLSNQRLSEIITFYNQNNTEDTCVKYDINSETLNRYKREYRVRFREVEPELKSPKVLILDIETAPIQAFAWGLWKQDISPSQIIRDWRMLTWSAKWLNDNAIYSGQVTPEEAIAGDDKRITQEIWNFVDACDVLIAHNGEKFDIPRLNTRFLMNGLFPPLSYQSIDTLKLARRKFAFSSNKLDYLGACLGLGGKIKTDFDLWKKVVNGDQEAINQMCGYNKRDVTLLEEVYLKIGNWMPSHPNLGLYVDDNNTLCPHCTSSDITWKGSYATMVGLYNSFRCNHCGFIGRARQNSLSKDKMKSLGVSIAR